MERGESKQRYYLHYLANYRNITASKQSAKTDMLSVVSIQVFNFVYR